MELTGEQLEAIDAGEAVTVTLDEKNVVVVREDVYEKLLPTFSGDIPSEVVATLVGESMADYDTDDPLLESYQKVK